MKEMHLQARVFFGIYAAAWKSKGETPPWPSVVPILSVLMEGCFVIYGVGGSLI